jgi:hypothetical protein
MSEYDVMKLAGHSDFKPTHKYYLVVKTDLADRARMSASRGLCEKLMHFGVPEGSGHQIFLSRQKV